MKAQAQKIEISKAEEIKPKYLMGTKAFHQLGDLSRPDYDLFSATGETENYWVGMWTFGYGFFNVLFPKETSRELTQEEIEKYNNSSIQINAQPPVKLKVN
jgi:hypothetical protein